VASPRDAGQRLLKGDLVFLRADADEGWDAEVGRVVEDQARGQPSVVTVELLPAFRGEDDPDLLRECAREDVVLIERAR
jgi:hypothetical protein